MNPFRTLKKRWIVRTETKRRGGRGKRSSERRARLELIAQRKSAIREDLVRAWNLGEIAKPTQKEWNEFYLYYHYLPWSYMVGVKRKYWNVEYIIKPNFHYPA